MVQWSPSCGYSQLRSITAPIRKLCIELMIKQIDYLDSVDWPQVDHILTNQEPLRWLTEVSVTAMSTSVIRGTIDNEALKVSVARRLPMTSWHPSSYRWKILGEHSQWVPTCTLDIGCIVCTGNHEVEVTIYHACSWWVRLRITLCFVF